MDKIKDVSKNLRSRAPKPPAAKTAPAPYPPENCIPDCPVCGGIGYLRRDVPVGHPEFGTLMRCPNAKILDAQKRQSDPRVGLSANEIHTLTWESILPATPIYSYVAEIREAFNKRSGFFLLVGEPGRGKTLLLKVVVAVAIHAEYYAAYANMSEILDDLRRSFDAQWVGSALAERMDWWMQQDVLSIDEYDKVNSTSWAQERMHLLMDTRYRKALNGEGITVVAANALPNDDYLISRFRDVRVGRIFKVSGGTDARTRAKPTWPR